MQILSSGQRQWLRKQAHHLRPIAQVGKNGLTAPVVAAVDQALAANELIKVKFLEHQEQRRELAGTLAEETGSELVAIIGNIAILYRQQPDPARRTIVLPA
ncbi:MAG TPA: ribosome assembly RNA-binding protein YhbY [Roseiflexaceae bacterium]|nr:ribosome assembly RNA-binding protein YhbY [Roseiflexaceae bacterium]